MVRIVTHQPASARFVVAKLWSHLAYPVATTDPVVGPLAAQYATDLNIKSLLRAILLHPAFTSPTAKQGLVKQPIEWVVGTARAFGVNADLQVTGAATAVAPASRTGEAALSQVLTVLAQQPFNPPNVGGWPQNGYWLNTATSLARLQAGLAFGAAARPVLAHRRARRPAGPGPGRAPVDRRVGPDHAGRPEPCGVQSDRADRPGRVRARIRPQLTGERPMAADDRTAATQPFPVPDHSFPRPDGAAAGGGRDAGAGDAAVAGDGAGAGGSRGVTRRRFLAGAAGVAGVGVAGAATLSLTHDSWRRWLAPASSSSQTLATGKGILVLVTLYGGNDGLNTVIPYQDPAYLQGRPNLGYQPHEVLALTDGLALHPNLKGLKALWDAKQLAVVRGVGYPDPVLSHFRGMDIWQTGSPEAAVATGVFGRWLDATGTDPMRAISIGSTLPRLLTGEKSSGTAIAGAARSTFPEGPPWPRFWPASTPPAPTARAWPPRWRNRAPTCCRCSTPSPTCWRRPAGPPRGGAGRGGTAGAGGTPKPRRGPRAAGRPAGHRGPAHQGREPDAGLPGEHGRLRQPRPGEGHPRPAHGRARCRRQRLHDRPRWAIRRVARSVLMTYSEFGRRVAENPSGGTDHGTAAPLFVAGPAVKGGQFYGDEPSLSRPRQRQPQVHHRLPQRLRHHAGRGRRRRPQGRARRSFPTLQLF